MHIKLMYICLLYCTVVFLLLISADDNTGPMKKWNSSALTALRGDLKRKVIIQYGLIDKLETAAGGFMNEAEAQQVESHKPNNANQMDELIKILQGKSNAAFGIFCQMLRDVSYETWADELEKKAKEFKGESSGTFVNY